MTNINLLLDDIAIYLHQAYLDYYTQELSKNFTPTNCE